MDKCTYGHCAQDCVHSICDVWENKCMQRGNDKIGNFHNFWLDCKSSTIAFCLCVLMGDAYCGTRTVQYVYMST
ncbi:hypothetical protein POVWA2_020160 [Plasmodium ovale wallikeri]|uniref:Uncharacterized protein n=1 Tax=Plasmodium ovale wallikeri TaxID=864142 RepID=A0A1A8YQU5_PLAOA|nr:hypothetical protein POVWA1_019970 [Plasmodium ovale wallikeri]SBT34527.1 hypothetical protein POVWA2_020160 [Plasmodium ovale wallikeri]